MTPTEQRPSECRHYKNGRFTAHNSTVCVNTLFSVRIGYEQGVIDHADSLVNEAKELRDRWRQDVDSLMASDTVIVTEREYTLIRQK